MEHFLRIDLRRGGPKTKSGSLEHFLRIDLRRGGPKTKSGSLEHFLRIELRREGRGEATGTNGKSPNLNSSASLDELSEWYWVIASLFFGCQLNAWFLFPTLCKGQERSAPKDAAEEEEDEEEEEEEEDDDDLFVLGLGVGVAAARGGGGGGQQHPLHPLHPSHDEKACCSSF